MMDIAEWYKKTCKKCNNLILELDEILELNILGYSILINYPLKDATQIVTEDGKIDGKPTKLGGYINDYAAEKDPIKAAELLLVSETKLEMVKFDEPIDAIKKTIAEGDTATINEIVFREMGTTIDAVIKKIEEERDIIEKEILFKNRFFKRVFARQFKSFDEIIAAIKKAIAEGEVNKRFLKLFKNIKLYK